MNTAKIIVVCLFACNLLMGQRSSKTEMPSILFLIGDGMGLSQISAGYYLGGEKSVFDQFKQIGLMRTHSKTHKVTDSAAASTAFATGQKTYNRAIGVDADTNHLKNLTEILGPMGYAHGLISLTSVTHATPAGFYAHVKDRDMEEEIAAQLPDSYINFISGGGYKFFGARTDGQNIIKRLVDKNFIVDSIQRYDQKLDPSKKYAFFLAENSMDMDAHARNDFLSQSLQQSLAYFDKKKQPFFIMAEGSYIDWAGHRMDADMLVKEQLDFQKAIEVALKYTQKNPNTLLLITGDHETGAMAVQKGNTPNEVSITFGGDQHTATMLPVFAFGKCAEKFQGVYENTDIFHKILECVKQSKK